MLISLPPKIRSKLGLTVSGGIRLLPSTALSPSIPRALDRQYSCLTRYCCNSENRSKSYSCSFPYRVVSSWSTILYLSVESMRTSTSCFNGVVGKKGDFGRRKGFRWGYRGFVFIFCQSKNEGDNRRIFRESIRDWVLSAVACWALSGDIAKTNPKRIKRTGPWLLIFPLQKVSNSWKFNPASN